MVSKSTDLKAKNLIIVSSLLAILLFASYYLSLLQSEEEMPVEEQPLIQIIAEEPIEEPIVEETETKTKEPEEITPVLIEIKNFQFIPREVNITVGQTVVWKNLDIFMGDVRPHMVAAHFREFRSPRLLINDTFYHTFTKIGRYTYKDAIFTTKMRAGVINVVAKETSMDSITGRVVGFNKSTLVSALIILLLTLVAVGLYNEKKLHLIIHHHKK